MTEHERQFVELYRKYRFDDQRGFYDRCRSEFEAARDESGRFISLFMILTGVVSALASVPNLGGLGWLWSVLAIVFPATASALTAFTNLYAFERQGKIYADAANSLIFARADAPELQQPMEAALSHEAISAHVLQVEQILLAEQAQWGQLIGEIKPSLSSESKA